MNPNDYNDAFRDGWNGALEEASKILKRKIEGWREDAATTMSARGVAAVFAVIDEEIGGLKAELSL